MGTVLERSGVVRLNEPLTESLWLMKVEVDDIGSQLQPGQFVHVQLPGMEGHILRRPFSIYYTEDDNRVLAILYQVVGFGSAHMTTLKIGAPLSIMGPIGHGWVIPEHAKRALLVAGGVGGAPLYLFAKQLKDSGVQVEVILGAKSAKDLVVKQRYQNLLGSNPYIATDDGSEGHHGFCTDLVAQHIMQDHFDFVACCGPEPMMHIVSDTCLKAGIATYISLEKRMACGIGACLSCIVETQKGRKRSCIDGPVFDAAEVIW